MTLQEIRAAFPGYHVNIEMYPTGGIIELKGCEECGTKRGAKHVGVWHEEPKSSPMDVLMGRQLSFAEAVRQLQKMAAWANVQDV